VVDDISQCQVRLPLDFKTVGPVLASIVQTLNQKEFNLRFGDIPQLSRGQLERRPFAQAELGGPGGDDASCDDEEEGMTQFGRRNVHDRNSNPKKSILENMTYSDELRGFLKST